MELLSNLWLGLSTAITPGNLLYCLAGVFLGTLIGVLPGLGPVATIAMLLPSIYALDATRALIMLADIYYGAQYGGSTTHVVLESTPRFIANHESLADDWKRAKIERVLMLLKGAIAAGPACCSR